MHNGQAFILHIYDSQNCKIDWNDPENFEKNNPGWFLINHITHKVGIAKKGMSIKINWYAEITYL